MTTTTSMQQVTNHHDNAYRQNQPQWNEDLCLQQTNEWCSNKMKEEETK